MKKPILIILLLSSALHGAAVEALAVDNTAVETVVIKEIFYPKNTEGPGAEIFISKAGITHGGAIFIPHKTGIPKYAYTFYPGDNDTSRWNPRKVICTGFLPDLDRVISRANELSAPEDILATLKKFFNSNNSFRKIRDSEKRFRKIKVAEIRSLTKKKWQENTCRHSLMLKSKGKKADEEFSKELDDILEYHRIHQL